MEKFGVIFASAQKNFGIAGITCVLVNKAVLPEKNSRKVPTIFDYHTHIAENSLYHTIPTYPVYVALLMLRYIDKQGGLAEMQRLSQEKSALIYNEIDRNPLLKGIVATEDRSVMNACFTSQSPEMDQKINLFLEQNDIVGIKGFPTKGGFRASIYNGQPLASVAHLVDLLQNLPL
jgi:phosphoserine aminotransferase